MNIQKLMENQRFKMLLSGFLAILLVFYLWLNLKPKEKNKKIAKSEKEITAHTEEGIIKEEQLDALKFSNISMITDKGYTTFTCDVTNTSSEQINPQAEKIRLEFSDSFKQEYEVGESLNLNGLTVSISYSDENMKKLPRSQYEISVSPDFGTKAGYETVTIRYGGLEESFTVRVINAENTSLLSSVYAIFPDTFTFTSSDLAKIDLKDMQVFAVYSDGKEKELSDNEYEITFENLSDKTEEKVMVTVIYKTTSCSFMIFKE